MNGSKITATYTLNPHYQVYYWTALDRLGRFSVHNGPWFYKLMPRADLALDFESVTEMIRAKAGLKRRWVATEVDQFVASYTWENGNNQVKFAIDAHDGRDIFSPELQKNCDIYFKANKWKSEVYQENVFPIVNGNGFLRERHLERLKGMRHCLPDNDFLFISRIWGGVEHNVRLFESLASLKCSKKLVAIFVKGAAGDEQTREAIRRLEAVGVTCTYGLLPIKSLWNDIASSRVVMVRAGKYMCIPWRMIDLLCMGTCIVTDADFEPQWPVPLVPGEHYISGGIERPADTSAADPAEYEKLRETISGLLQQKTQIEELKRNSGTYFDTHGAPGQVGKYIHSCLERFVAD